MMILDELCFLVVLLLFLFLFLFVVLCFCSMFNDPCYLKKPLLFCRLRQVVGAGPIPIEAKTKCQPPVFGEKVAT